MRHYTKGTHTPNAAKMVANKVRVQINDLLLVSRMRLKNIVSHVTPAPWNDLRVHTIISLGQVITIIIIIIIVRVHISRHIWALGPIRPSIAHT